MPNNAQNCASNLRSRCEVRGMVQLRLLWFLGCYWQRNTNTTKAASSSRLVTACTRTQACKHAITSRRRFNEFALHSRMHLSSSPSDVRVARGVSEAIDEDDVEYVHGGG